MEETKPLTKEFRKQILDALQNKIEEASKYDSIYSTIQIIACEQQIRIIKALPDYYPVPVSRSE